MKHRRATLWLVLVLLPLAASAWLFWPQPVPEYAAVRAAYRPSEAYLLDRHGRLLDSRRVDFGVRRFRWVALDEVSPALIDAIVAGEDRRFWQHDGVDPRAVLAALRDRLWYQRPRGASTISMQLASLLGQTAARSQGAAGWRRKLEQVRVAWSLEARWSKAQILEAYLNLLDYRGEWQGIGAAAWGLAQTSPSGLSVVESEVLAALLPAPSASFERVADRACARAKARDSGMACAALRDSAQRLLAASASRMPAQRLAPHLADTLLSEPGEQRRTTLDAGLQRFASDTLRLHLAGLTTRNVRDGAALVVDNDSGEVLAYVASAGPNSRSAAVDGVRARRQAGSTLKPFLYELAIERRYLTAASLLDDSPVSLDTARGAYLPQNYDRDFKGLVSVRTALASSLNVPAVRSLVLTGVEPFRDRLFALGYAGIDQSGEYYGFSLALGSAEVSVWEQAQAYRALARGGLWSPLRLQAGSATEDERRIFAEAPAFIVGDMLSDRAARVLSFGLDNHLNTPFWSAVKTGTSKDMRDNWCIGFSDRYTVAVWVGNFEGDAMQDVSGMTGAGPVWSELMRVLHETHPSQAPGPPGGLVQHSVTFRGGLESARQEWFLAGTESALIAPLAARRARIVSPANGLVIALDPDMPARRQRIPIRVADAAGGTRLELDGQAIAVGDQPLLWPPRAGAHRLHLRDVDGRLLDQVLFTVR